MTEPSPDAAPSSNIPKKKREPTKEKRSTPEERAAALKQLTSGSDDIPELKGGRGKRIPQETLTKLMDSMRSGIAKGMHPRAVREACVSLYGVSSQTVDTYMKIVKQDLIKQEVYFPAQIRNVVHNFLMEVAQDKSGDISHRLRAVDKLTELFDVKVTAEDKDAAEEQVFNEQVTRLKSMSLQQLYDQEEQWRTRGMTADVLFAPSSPPGNENKTRNRTKRKKKP